MHRKKHNVCIVGDGGWGTALGLVLHDNGHNVTVWGPFPEYVEMVRQTGENRTFLPDVRLPPDMKWTSDHRDAVAGADVVVLAVPTKYFRQTVGSFAGLIEKSALVLSVAKGLDEHSFQRMTEVAEDVLAHKPVAVLSGPSLADEVARKVPTAVCVASSDPDQARQLQTIFSNARFRVYTSDDAAGLELGGALKNIIAIAVGASDGLGFGDNTRAAIITRGLVEITRLGVALGAKPSTFSGLSGLGDLVVTCTSRLSRNHGVGERLGRGETMEHILKDMKKVAEGVGNCAVARQVARKLNVDTPIIEEVYAVVHKGKSPLDAVTALMGRSVKPEAV